jgi:hypothetical protein
MIEQNDFHEESIPKSEIDIKNDSILLKHSNSIRKDKFRKNWIINHKIRNQKSNTKHQTSNIKHQTSNNKQQKDEKITKSEIKNQKFRKSIHKEKNNISEIHLVFLQKIK